MKKWIYFIIPLLLGACTLTVVIDLPEQEPKAVINAFFSPDSSWRVQITKSRGMYDTGWQFSPVSNAQVSLMKNGQFDQQLMYDAGKGYFFSNQQKPEVGAAYRIEVSAPGIVDTAVASDTVPVMVQIQNLVVNRNVSVTPEGDTLSEVKFSIDDPAGANYYGLELLTFNSTSPGNFWDICYQSNDPVLNSGNNWLQVGLGDNSICNRVYFSDDLIDGKTHQFSFMVSEYELNLSDGLMMVLFSVSKSYFTYSLTRDLQMNTQGNPFAEPVLVYDNVQNGLGIFAAYSLAYDLVIF